MIYLRMQALAAEGPSGPILSPLPAWEQGWPDTFRAYLTEKCVRLNTSKSSVYFLTTEK